MTRRPRSDESAAREAASPRAAVLHPEAYEKSSSAHRASIEGWWRSYPDVRVSTGAEAAALDSGAIGGRGIPSRALMQRAGAAAAAYVLALGPERLGSGVAVFCGAGNNGGDGWVIARSLAAAGVRVRVDEVQAARSADCVAERGLALPLVMLSQDDGGERVVVDAVLGTGATGEPHGDAAAGLERLSRAASRGAFVVAVDLPSGLNATDGSGRAVAADLTLTFGTVKRGLLAARDLAGDIALVDIGLPQPSPELRSLPRLADAGLVRRVAPKLPARAHKGTRRKLAVVGGANGMAGAAVLASRAALATGVGMVRAVVASGSQGALQSQVPAAMCMTWPLDDDEVRQQIAEWADGLVIGPGLGRSREAAEVVERLLGTTRVPVLLDADALNLFEGRVSELSELLRGRPAAITPHVAEYARLSGSTVEQALADPYSAARTLACELGAVVLLKGVPTVAAAPDGRVLVSASGTPVLATAGSGDILAGVAGTLLAQNPDSPLESVAAAAWAHGRSAELAGRSGARGVPVEAVIDRLPDVWSAYPATSSPLSIAWLTAPTETEPVRGTGVPS